jgi:hypothetical protein
MLQKIAQTMSFFALVRDIFPFCQAGSERSGHYWRIFYTMAFAWYCVENLHKGLVGILDGYESIGDQKTDVDCAKALGLRHKMASFATVALMMDIFLPVDIFKTQVQLSEGADACWSTAGTVAIISRAAAPSSA